MALAFTKTTYQNGVTVIYAENLNDIQDAILYLLEHEGEGGSVTVDTSLDDTSTNPVQNKAIAAALADKLNANLGAANAGKFLLVGSGGAVTPTTMQEWQGGSY